MKPKMGFVRWHLMAIAFILSAGMLAYEILLTRIASVLLISQYTFLILGVSLLGISLGAVTEYFIANRSEQTIETTPGLWLGWNAGFLVLSVIALLMAGAEGGLFVLTLSAALPFAVSGYLFSRLFRLFPEITGRLYAADLVGAAAGALSVPILLPAYGPVQSIILIAAVQAGFGAVSLILDNSVRKALLGMASAAVAIGLLYFNSNDVLLGKIPIGNDPDKDLYRITALQGSSAEIVESRWSTFGRTDLVRFDGDSSMMSIFIDGAAGTTMLQFHGNFENASENFVHATQRFGGMVPLLNLEEYQKDRALIIGPGGGRDVLLALKAGFKKITAVEINPQMVDIVKDYRDFNGGIYTDYGNVEVVVAEGRNYLRHSNDKYDLIMLFMPITKSSRSLNAFALSESYLFTKEAFEDYYRHLTDEGSLLIMAHGMPEMLKLMTTALEALREDGLTVERAMDHVYVLGSEMMPLFGMNKTPVQPEQSEFLHSAAHYTMFDCRYSYIPGVEQRLIRPALATSIDAGVPMMNPLFIDLAEGAIPLERIERGLGFNFVPASDNQPFFFQYGFGLPDVVFIVLWLALAVLGIILFVPGYQFRFRQQSSKEGFSWWLPVFFVAIGIGYIVLELALFQKLVFYLGDPSRSLALLLAALLIGSGVGSFISRKSRSRVAIASGLVSAVLAMLILALLPRVFAALHDTSLLVQQSVAAATLFIQGVPMGVMFPIGLRRADKLLGRLGVPWMWAINGSAAVVGSALAIAVAMSAGYTWHLIFGAASYVVATVAMLLLQQQQPEF